jgi:sulfite reductase alpha subunit-like flavoprotein/pSer/pThr/pTyr-binding forkhead associated (FHA) protein
MVAEQTILSQRHSSGTLVIRGGADAGTKFVLKDGAAIIGREKGVDILLADRQCSRQHCRIISTQNQFMIEDLKSMNGTRVNGIPVTTMLALKSGDQIALGETLLDFEIKEPEVISTYENILKDQGIVPSRYVLSNALATSQSLGHENLGFLSEEHGFMPIQPPLLKLPPAYQAWEDIVDNLPDLYRTLELRAALEQMPGLSADVDTLPDKYLLRASMIISIFGHAYYRIQTDALEKMPDSIMQPWQKITQRLGRPGPVLSYIDLIIYNWKLVNPSLTDPIIVENMRLMVPTVDNIVERIFYLGQVEILSRLTPVIGAAVRAQESVYRDDPESLKQELVLISEALQQATYGSLQKIDLNPHNRSYHLDTIVWAKTVGPLAVSLEASTPGPSGIASPIFHLLDEFLGRQTYTTRLGEEMTRIRAWYPPNWQNFLKAIGQISVADYVEKSRSKTLKGIFQETRQAYVAETGFLGRHRLKAYGFLETAFKVGRSVTIGSFSGKFKDRAWDEVHTQLNNSQLERSSGHPQYYHYADVMNVNTLGADGPNWVKQVVLNTSGTGISYQVGDRAAILPENSEALVDKTLQALRARGREAIFLNKTWREAIVQREGYEDTPTLPLRTLLTFGRIRPVDRDIAKTLYVVTHNSTLKRIIEARAEDQWELWDVLNLISKAGFDARRFWKASPGELESICRIVPPEVSRMYSVSSVMKHDERLTGASELHLTIGRLSYKTGETEVSPVADRLGTSSNYLTDTSGIAPEDMGKVSFRVVHPPRFNMPGDEKIPIVMIAGGTGLAPFRSFILKRAQQSQPGETWLFFGTRTRTDIYYKEELERLVAQKRLNLRIAFSQDDVSYQQIHHESGDELLFGPGEKHYIGDEILKEENAQALWNLLQSRENGGQGAYFYICGRTGFASAAMDAIKAVIYQHSSGSEGERQAVVKATLYDLVGKGRYLQDIFSTYTGSHLDAKKATYNASDVALHNDDEHGYWMIIDGRVYDVTEFAQLHPGGAKIIREYTGMDATQPYQKILHSVNPEVDSMLGMYEIGKIRRLNFGAAWGVYISSDGLKWVTLADVYRIWIRYLYFLVELENSLHNEFTIQDQATTVNENPAERSPYKSQLIMQVYKRFMNDYINSLTGEPLELLWAVTSGLCSPGEDVNRIHKSVAEIQQSDKAQFVKGVIDGLHGSLLTQVREKPGQTDLSENPVLAYFSLLEAEDKAFMKELRMSILAGIRVFEEFESDTIVKGSERLINAAREIPARLESYYSRVASRIQSMDLITK